jgi:hypothetical protein
MSPFPLFSSCRQDSEDKSSIFETMSGFLSLQMLDDQHSFDKSDSNLTHRICEKLFPANRGAKVQEFKSHRCTGHVWSTRPPVRVQCFLGPRPQRARDIPLANVCPSCDSTLLPSLFKSSKLFLDQQDTQWHQRNPTPPFPPGHETDLQPLAHP